MSLGKLNHHELRAMRKLLMLDVSEAAEFVGFVSTRTWQQWEDNKKPIPVDVTEAIYALNNQRYEAIDGIISHDIIGRPIRWYYSLQKFQKDYGNSNIIWWRLYQSVLTYIFSTSYNITSIELDINVPLNEKSFLFKFFSNIEYNIIQGSKDGDN